MLKHDAFRNRKRSSIFRIYRTICIYKVNLRHFAHYFKAFSKYFVRIFEAFFYNYNIVKYIIYKAFYKQFASVFTL